MIFFGSRNFAFLFIVLFWVSLTGGCISLETQSPTATDILKERESLSQNKNLVWPPPPQRPRIQYLRNISSSADIRAKKSGFKKMLESIFGEEETGTVMLRPYGVYACADTIYVTDPGANLLHVFDMKDKGYSQIKEVKGEDLVSPIGIVVDKDGKIYLSDSILKKVFVLNKKGEYLRQIGVSGTFMRPTGIAIDEERIYVVDTLGHCILVFNKEDGKFLFHFGKNGIEKGEFNYPTNIFIDKNKLVYIVDSLNFRVQMFDRDGKFLSSFGKLGDGSGDFSKAKGIAVDSESHIYVTDAHFDNIQIFDRNGKLLLGFGGAGRQAGDMTLPAGIFIDEYDRIYVVDSYNSRIQIFQYLKERY